MGDKIEELVARWCAGAATEYSCDMRSSSVRTIAGPIPVALARDLEAIASLTGRDPSCMAGDLLAAAIADAVAALPETVRTALRASKASGALAKAQAQQEALNWDPGRT